MSEEDGLEAELNDIENTIHDAVRDGLIEVAEEKEGHNTKYKLTDYGNVEAERTIAEKGLPFLLMISSKKAIADNKDRTVKSMADEIIAKFPNKLKRETKRNFSMFWHEYASMSPHEYIDAYTEAQNE